MTPLYVYRCPEGHEVELLVRFKKRDDNLRYCGQCGKRVERQVSAPHIVPDGVYSHAPNLGDPDTFERQHETIRRREK